MMLASTQQYMEDLEWMVSEWLDAPRQKMPKQYYENELYRLEAFYS